MFGKDEGPSKSELQAIWTRSPKLQLITFLTLACGYEGSNISTHTHLFLPVDLGLPTPLSIFPRNFSLWAFGVTYAREPACPNPATLLLPEMFTTWQPFKDTSSHGSAADVIQKFKSLEPKRYQSHLNSLQKWRKHLLSFQRAFHSSRVVLKNRPMLSSSSFQVPFQAFPSRLLTQKRGWAKIKTEAFICVLRIAIQGKQM